MSNPISQYLRSIDGARIPGGCNTCDAYQTVHAGTDHPDIHRLTTHHDEWCPTYHAMQARATSPVQPNDA